MYLNNQGDIVMANKKEKEVESKTSDARDVLDNGGENSELNAIAIKSITNIEEKIEAMDWKLWEIYNIIKNYVESNPVGVGAVVAPQVQQPQPSTADIAAEVAKQLQGNSAPEEKKSVVGKLFGK
jgi:hypothetical protein